MSELNPKYELRKLRKEVETLNIQIIKLEEKIKTKDEIIEKLLDILKGGNNE